MLRIGKLANPENAAGRDKFINALDSMSGRYVDILKEFDLLPNPERDVLHFETDWFPSTGYSRWFPKENGQ